MNSSDSNPANDDELLPSDEREVNDAMFDALLTEVLLAEALFTDEPGQPGQRQAPPDQTRIILQKWHESPTGVPKMRSTPKPTSSQGSNSSSSTKWIFAAVVAAGLMVAGGIVWGLQSRIKLNQLAQNNATHNNATQSSEPERITAAPPAVQRPNESGGTRDAPSEEPSPRRVIELAGPSQGQSALATMDARGPAKNQSERNASDPPRPIQPIQLIAHSMDRHLERYWKRMDVEATSMLSSEQTAARIEERFGIQIQPDSIGDPDAILEDLQRDENLEKLANQFFETLSRRSPSARDSSKRAQESTWVTQLRQTWEQRSGMDRLITSWLDSPDLAREIVGSDEPHELLTSVAALTHNVDLRCQRCHDMPALRRSPSSQDEYWRFAATILPVLNPNIKQGQRFFYDTPDGRRKLAEARPELKPTEDNLIGSRPLAGGLVDWVWRMIHGRPLVTSAYDLAGTADEEMQKLHQDLTDDLVASDFDLLRTISLVMNDSILGRSVPDAMTPEGILAASDESWSRAVAAIDSFAAANPKVNPTSTGDRLRLVAEVGLPRLDQLGGVNAILAQPLGNSESESSRPGKDSENRMVSAAAFAGLPMRSTWVMPAWMDRLEDFGSRSQHIAHLAGKIELPRPVASLAERMRKAGVDESLILQRIWWIIQPHG